MSEKKTLGEGFVKAAASAVQGYFDRQQTSQAASALRYGGTSESARAGWPYYMAPWASGIDGQNQLLDVLRIDQDLVSRYVDYEEMDDYPMVSVALDIYADDSTMPNTDDRSIWAVSTDKALQKELDEVLFKRCGVEDDIWGNVRTLSKYGSSYGELLVTAEHGLVGINYMPTPSVRRVEDERSNLMGFVQDVRGRFTTTPTEWKKLMDARMEGSRKLQTTAIPFEDWEVIHWRLRGKHMHSMYGHGVIEPARWAFRRLAILEDSMIQYKLERAPSRYAFYVDVGTLDSERGLAYVNRVKNQNTRKRFVNSSGKMEFRNQVLTPMEDFYIPVRDGKRSTEIEILQGPDYTETDSLEYTRDQLTSALKVPKSSMGYGGEGSSQPLSSTDIRFARTVMRVQRATRVGYDKGLRIHLIATNRDPDKADFGTRMTIPSTILELARMEVIGSAAQIAGQMGEMVPTRWILTRLFKMTDQEATQLMREKASEKIAQAKTDADIQAMMMGDEEGATESRRPIRAVLKEDWRREFESGTASTFARLDTKFEALARGNDASARRLKHVEGLLVDIRRGMRYGRDA